MPLEVLVSTFVEGVTQDKDLLFLNQEIQRLNEGEHTLTIVRREDNPKKTVQQEIEFLEGKKRQAIMAMLYTASDLSLRVTALIDSDPEKFKHLKQRTHSYEALMDRLVRHARSYYVWCALGTPRSKVKLESVRKQKIPSAIKKKLNQLEKELIKLCGKTVEEARIKIRSLRDECNKKTAQAEEDGSISEDEKFRIKEKIQKIVDEANKKVEEALSLKVKEIEE